MRNQGILQWNIEMQTETYNYGQEMLILKP